jgi:hypothetical protein
MASFHDMLLAISLIQVATEFSPLCEAERTWFTAFTTSLLLVLDPLFIFFAKSDNLVLLLISSGVILFSLLTACQKLDSLNLLLAAFFGYSIAFSTHCCIPDILPPGIPGIGAYFHIPPAFFPIDSIEPTTFAVNSLHLSAQNTAIQIIKIQSISKSTLPNMLLVSTIAQVRPSLVAEFNCHLCIIVIPPTSHVLIISFFPHSFLTVKEAFSSHIMFFRQ